MRRNAAPTSPGDRAALGLLAALGALLTLVGGLRSLAPTLRGPLASALLAAGLVLLFARFVLRSRALWLARPMHRALEAVGLVVGDAILTLLFVLVVWPYAALLKLAGRLPAATEPWPPSEESGWVPVEGHASRRASRPGSFLATLTVRAGAAAALLRHLRDRPTAYLVPLVVLLLLLAAIVLLGNSTGLGPLIYTLF